MREREEIDGNDRGKDLGVVGETMGCLSGTWEMMQMQLQWVPAAVE